MVVEAIGFIVMIYILLSIIYTTRSITSDTKTAYPFIILNLLVHFFRSFLFSIFKNMDMEYNQKSHTFSLVDNLSARKSFALRDIVQYCKITHFPDYFSQSYKGRISSSLAARRFCRCISPQKIMLVQIPAPTAHRTSISVLMYVCGHYAV